MTERLPLWLECYVLELPFDSGVPDNYALHVKDDVSSPVERGWDGFALGVLLGINPEPPTGQMQSTTLCFRHADVPTSGGFDAWCQRVPSDARDSADRNCGNASPSPPSRDDGVGEADRDLTRFAMSAWPPCASSPARCLAELSPPAPA